jgi:hypothetical protein
MKSTPVAVGDIAQAAQYNKLRDDAYGGSQFLAHQQSSPGMTLYVEPGVCYIGPTQIVYAGGNSPTFTAPSGNPQIDILTIDSVGNLAITQGSENASPVAPAYPVNKIVLAEIYNRVGETALYDSDQGSNGYIKKDARAIVQLGGYISSSNQVDATLFVKLAGNVDETITGVKTFASDPIIPDEAYGSGWNGVLKPPTKNAVYDKIETLVFFDETGNASGRSANTVYQESTDGWVIFEVTFGTSAGSKNLQFLTDGSNPPTTQLINHTGNGGSPEYSHVCVPVKKNNYWKVVPGSGMVAISNLYFISLA